MDEMGVHTGMQRTQARSRRGERAYSPQWGYRGQKTTVIGAMNQSQWLAKRTLTGSMKTDDFFTFIQED
jgi:putative transposase